MGNSDSSRTINDQRSIIFAIFDDVSPIRISGQSLGVTNDYHQTFRTSK